MSERMEAIRSEVRRLVRANPFHSFMLILENGERLHVDQPHSTAFDPGSANGMGRSRYFYVIAEQQRHLGTFDEVNRIVLLNPDSDA